VKPFVEHSAPVGQLVVINNTIPRFSSCASWNAHFSTGTLN